MSSVQISAAATYSARCVRSLCNALHLLHKEHAKLSSPNSVLLFALAPSPTTPPEALSDITSTVTQLFPEHIGCISAPLPNRYLNANISSHSCSLAYALVNGVSFRSTIPGHAQAQVGRWHASRQRNTEDANGPMQVDWEEVWDRASNPVASSRKNGGPDTLPDALKKLDPSATHDILYFSDKAPEGLVSALDSTFPQANKVSLIASSTPFITGRPVTLFRNGSIHSDGAVGIAFHSAPSLSQAVIELSFPPLARLSSDLNVTSCKGNLILSLDTRNPTQLLLAAIQKHGITLSHETWVDRYDDFYVGVLDSSKQHLSQLHRIHAGDPSRGAIALDAVSAVKEGSIIRLYRFPRGPVPEAERYVPNTISRNISFFTAPDTQLADFESGIADEEVEATNHTVVHNNFLAASENGFTASRGLQGFWKCVVPGGRLRLSWTH